MKRKSISLGNICQVSLPSRVVVNEKPPYHSPRHKAQQTGQGYQLGKPKSSSLLLTFVVIAHLATVGVFFSVPCASAAPTLSSMGLNPGVDFLSVQGHRSFFSWKALRR